MKKTMLAALGLWLCLLAAACLGEEEWTLPEGVRTLCEAAHPGYAVAAYHGWGDETRGQVALVLHKDMNNILCIAEKAEGDAAYALTVDNDRALREGEEIPSLLVDTGGDSLFYTYRDGEAYMTRYHSVKENGVWNEVNVELLDTSAAAYDEEMWVSLRNGYLCLEHSRWDKQENRLPGGYALLPVPVSQAYAKSMRLASFDYYALVPSWGAVRADEGLCDGLLEAGDTLLAVSIQRQSLVMLVQKADGTRRIRIADEDYNVVETNPTPDDASLDTYHMGEGQLFLGSDGGYCYHNFERGLDGKWYFSSVQADESFNVRYDGLEDWEKYAGVCSNDGVIYGDMPWSADITKLDLRALPRTIAEAVSQMDTSHYAFVNNPDPADRLHLRAKPEKGAASLGKFYNRTPVYVLEERGDWAHVRIGREDRGLNGWMMKKFLACGGDREDVACAFPSLYVREELGSTELLAEPRAGAASRGEEAGFYIIGVCGDDWTIVMTEDGTVGYVRSCDLWAGNG